MTRRALQAFAKIEVEGELFNGTRYLVDVAISLVARCGIHLWYLPWWYSKVPTL